MSNPIVGIGFGPQASVAYVVGLGFGPASWALATGEVVVMAAGIWQDGAAAAGLWQDGAAAAGVWQDGAQRAGVESAS